MPVPKKTTDEKPEEQKWKFLQDNYVIYFSLARCSKISLTERAL